MPELTDKTIVDNMLRLHDRRKREGTEYAGGYAKAAFAELAELGLADTESDRREEFGDVLCNVLLLGASLGIRHPLGQAQASLDKVNRRIDYIYERATTKPGDPGHREEFSRLWAECKRAARTSDT